MYYAKSTTGEMSITLPGIPYSTITIEKKDKDTGKELADVRLVVQYKETGEWIVKGTPAGRTDDIYQATQYKSGEKVDNLDKPGTYVFYEVQRQDDGYEYASLENPLLVGEITVNLGETKTITIENQRIYVKLAGYVWEDIAWNYGKADYKNGLYQNEELDVKDNSNIYEVNSKNVYYF